MNDKEHEKDNRGIVVVSCSGKCGSISLMNTFMPHFKTFHSHYFKRRGRLPELTEIQEHVCAGCPTIFICGVRDPLSRRISSFFHNIDINLKMRGEDIIKGYVDGGESYVLSLIDRFNAEFLQKVEPYFTYDEWKLFGYNPLTDAHFDHDNKYQYYNQYNKHFLIVRFDEIKEWSHILNHSPIPLAGKEVRVPRENIASTKWYGQLYSDFKRLYSLSQEDLDGVWIYCEARLKHFWSEEELQQMRARYQELVRT